MRRVMTVDRPGRRPRDLSDVELEALDGAQASLETSPPRRRPEQGEAGFLTASDWIWQWGQ